MFQRKKVPSLVDLCVQTTIDNVRYLGNVGETDAHLLERILPHCTLDQLMHVEKSTEGRDLSPVTDKLWKRFFEKQFGTNCTNRVVKRLRDKKASYKWIQLYEAKVKEVAEAENQAVARIKQRYKKIDDRKQSRQVKLCTKVPPSSKRKFWGDGGSSCNVSHLKSNIMKKSKIEYLKSIWKLLKPQLIRVKLAGRTMGAKGLPVLVFSIHKARMVEPETLLKGTELLAAQTNRRCPEVKNLAAMKKNSIQRSHSSSSVIKRGGISGNGSTSRRPIL